MSESWCRFVICLWELVEVVDCGVVILEEVEEDMVGEEVMVVVVKGVVDMVDEEEVGEEVMVGVVSVIWMI